jgi:dipeptidyl aminopeptidase/acylaminoacyl peptidase
LVAAAVALFPVTDLVDLHLTTHRFESGYNLRMVGPWPEARQKYVDHSPLSFVSEIRAPVLLLHGSADKSVPPAQSAAVEQALQRTGVPVERHVYEGEGHGWRRAATVADEVARIDAFTARWL